MSDATATPRIHTHRGDSAQYPENTMAAFRTACALCVDAMGAALEARASWSADRGA